MAVFEDRFKADMSVSILIRHDFVSYINRIHCDIRTGFEKFTGFKDNLERVRFVQICFFIPR